MMDRTLITVKYCIKCHVAYFPFKGGHLIQGHYIQVQLYNFSTFKFKSPDVVRPVNTLLTSRAMSANMTRKGSLPEDIVGCFWLFLVFL